MKKAFEKYVSNGIIIIGVIVLIYFAYSFLFPAPGEKGLENYVSLGSLNTITTGTTDDDDITIELTPQKIENGKLFVAIAVNTHSVDLSQFNLQELVVLDYKGDKIKPISAPSLSGHHANGELVFEVGKQPSTVTITIRGIPKQSERIYNWIVPK